MLKFSGLFLLLLILLFGIGLTNVVYDNVILPFTSGVAAVSAAILTAFDADVTSHSNILRSTKTGFSVIIESGCNGVEAMMILIAGILSFPSTYLQKFFAIVGGFIAIQGFNLLRIISLFYLGQWNMTVFEWAHLYLWPALIIVDVLLVFYVWLRIINKNKTKIEQQVA